MVVPPKSIYSVPRKLDLSSLFVFTTAYGLLFALMNVFSMGPEGFAIVAGFFTSLGLSQAILFKGKSPRLASSLTGAIYVVCCLGGFSRFSITSIGTVIFALVGALLGYLFGACIGGIFLVTDILRNRLEEAMVKRQGAALDELEDMD